MGAQKNRARRGHQTRKLQPISGIVKCATCGTTKLKHLNCTECTKTILEKTKEMRKEVVERGSELLSTVLAKRQEKIERSISMWDGIADSLKIDTIIERKPHTLKKKAKGTSYKL